MLKEKLKSNKYVANTAGFSIAVANNFFLNYIWTFKGTVTGIPSAFGLFFAIALIGLLLNSCFIYAFHELKKVNFYISKTGAIIFVFFWNFSANYFLNFHSIIK
jgi:putative flippase GtrA